MNKKFNFSLSKDKINTVTILVIVMVLLAAVLGVASYFTVKRAVSTSESIKTVKAELEDDKLLITRLKALRSNAEYYQKQREEYDKVIADYDSYNRVDYYIALDEMCRDYNLKVEELTVGDLEPMGNVNMALTTLTVTGQEIDVRSMAKDIVSQLEIARIDDIAMVKGEDGTVTATMKIVNFTK